MKKRAKKVEDMTMRELIKSMTPRERKFADLYIKTANGTQSYIDAGNTAASKNTAAVQAHHLLRKPNINRYINLKLEQISDDEIASAKEVLEYLTSVMRGERKEQTLIGTGGGHQGITEIAVSEKDKIKSAELIGKRYGIWIEKVDMNEDITINIQRKEAD